MSLLCISRFTAACAAFLAISVVSAQSNYIYNDLHDFGGSVKNAGGKTGADGAWPWSTVTFDASGNMYGTSAYGGANSRGLLWEITKAGSYIDLHDFGGTVTNANGTMGPDGDIPYGGVSFDGAGNMYGTALFGGPIGNGDTGFSGMIWEFTKGGKYVDLHDFGGSDGGNPAGGVTVDQAGNLYGTASAGGLNGDGVDGAGMLWEITVSGSYSNLHNFGGTVTNAGGAQVQDGYVPFGAVAFDSAGNMYGTASKGGANGGGVVWELSKSGTYTDLHDFGGTVTVSGGAQGQDGSIPYGTVAVDGNGNLYGTAVWGGANGSGMLWRISSTGTYTDLHDFGGTITNANGTTGPDGMNPYAGVVIDSGGDLIGTTSYGGPNSAMGESSGMVWELKNGGTYLDLHDFGGMVLSSGGMWELDGMRPWYGVTLDKSGDLYGTDAYGGPNGSGLGSGTVWALYLTQIKSLSISPNSVFAGNDAVGTVTLSAPAPSTGLVIPLSSNNACAGVPSFVTIQAGSSSATFTVATTGVNVRTSAVVTAGAGVTQQSGVLTVNPVTLTNLSLSPTSIGGGSTSTGTVTLSGPAGPGGVVVSLSTIDTGATLPASVQVPAGASTATFTISTKAVQVATAVMVAATLGSSTETATLTITPAALLSVTVSPSMVIGGTTSTGTVSLNGNVFTGSFVVSLSSGNPSVIVPKSVTIPAGSSSATFSVTTKAVATATTVTITAKNGVIAKTGSISVVPPVLASLSVSPTTVAPGGLSTGTLSIGGPAPAGGLSVLLSSTSSKLTIPARVVIAAGKSTATFSIRTTKATPAGSVTITATQAGSTKSATLTIS